MICTAVQCVQHADDRRSFSSSNLACPTYGQLALSPYDLLDLYSGMICPNLWKEGVGRVAVRLPGPTTHIRYQVYNKLSPTVAR